MSVGSGVPYNAHTGNGLSTVFAYGFTLLAAADLVATIDGVVTSDYTVSGIGVAAGGSIAFSSAPANGTAVLLRRVIQLVRSTEYQSNGDLQAETVNDDFDRLWTAVQQVNGDSVRALRAPELAGVDDIPAAATRANRLLAFDGTGAPEETPFTTTQVASAIAAAYTGMGTADAAAFIAAGTGAVTRTMQDKGREIISPADYTGFDGTGATDSTAAVQAAVVYAESLTGTPEIRFPPGATVDLKMVFITTGGLKLNGNGCTIVQNHDSVNSVTVGGVGQYKVSNAFNIKRGAVDVEITGFDFTTDDASFPAFAAGYGSYFASIGGQHFERLNIHHNRFRGGQRRALFVQAGQKLRFTENTVEGCGITVHVGFTLNVLFYDGSTSTANKYSPSEVYIVDNVFDGYTATDPGVCLFLTGAIRPTVRGNKVINMDEATALRGIMVYSNDNGPYETDGTALSYIEGDVTGNTVTGTFLTGIMISGASSGASAAWTNSYRMGINVASNVVRGTGGGIRVVQARGTKVQDNIVTVSKSPLYLDGLIEEIEIEDNRFESTASGQNLTTIYTDWDANAAEVSFCGNRIVTPAADQYAFRSASNLNGLVMDNNVWEFGSDVALCRTIVLTLGGASQIENNKFEIDTDTADVSVMVLVGNANAGSLSVQDNKIVSVAGAGATSLRFAAISNFADVWLSGNATKGAVLVEDCDRAYIAGNTIILPSGNTWRGIYCDNAGYAAKAFLSINSNYVLMPAALNVPCIAIASNNDASLNALSKVTLNRVEGNSSGVLIQQTAHGVIETLGNTLVNNGAGGITIGVSGSASATAL